MRERCGTFGREAEIVGKIRGWWVTHSQPVNVNASANVNPPSRQA